MSDSDLAATSQELELASRRVWPRLACLVLAAAALWLLAGLLHSSKAAAEAPPRHPVAATLGTVDRLLSPVLKASAHSVPAKSVPAHSVPAHSVPAHSVPAHSVPAKSVPAAPVRMAAVSVANGVRATVGDVAETVQTVVNATTERIVRPVVDQIVAPVIKPILAPVTKLVPPIVSPLPPVAGLVPIAANPVITAVPAAWPEGAADGGQPVHAASAASAVVSATEWTFDQTAALSVAPSEAQVGRGVPAGTPVVAPSVPSQPDRVPAPSAPAVPGGSVALSTQPNGPLTFISLETIAAPRLEATGRARLATQAANPKNTAADPAFSPD